MNKHKLFSLVLVLVFILSLGGIPPTSVFAEESSPYIQAFPDQDRVNANNWPMGTDVTMTINGSDPYISKAGQSSWDTYGTTAGFDVRDRGLKAGDNIIITGGGIIRSMTVTALQINSIDANTSTVSGTTDSDKQVYVWVKDGGGIWLTPGDGAWTAEFSPPPFVPGTNGGATQPDVNGNVTQVSWKIPNPYLQVFTSQDTVSANDWPIDTEVSLTINDASFGTAIAGPSAWDPYGTTAEFFLQDHDIKADDVISVTSAGITRSMTVTSLEITNINVNNATVSGIADVDKVFQVWVNGGSHFYITPDANGEWTANFAPFVFVPGTNGGAQQTDELGNYTQIDWRVPDPPAMDAYPYRFGDDVSNEVFGNDWPVGAAIKVQIDDPKINGTGWDYTDTLTAQAGVNCFAGNQLCFQPDPNVFKILPGQLIRMTDVTHNTFKEHVVTNLNIITLDFTEDTVSGRASLGWHYFLTVFSEDGCNTGRWVTADMINGDWSADFGHSGSNSGEEQTCDFKEGVFRLFIPEDTDADGDATKLWTGGPFIGGSIIASPPSGVNGENWPLGEEVKMTIHIPDDDSDNDKIAIGLPEQSEWNHFQSWIHFDLGNFELRPGYEITFESQSYIKTHKVLDLALISIDVEHDIISGTADAGAKIEVWEDNTTIRRITTAIGGNWSVDFSDPDNGEGGQGQTIFDIKPWTSGTVKAYISDWDSSTQISWFAPAPECQPGDTVTGVVFEHDGITPVPFAYIQIDDYNSGEVRFASSANENGQFGCFLPDGDYRIMASANNYSAEYFYETGDPAAATPIQVTGNSQFASINFTLAESFAIEHFTFNLSNPLLQEYAVRQAIALGTDRLRILNEAFLPNGIYGILSNSIVGPGHWAAAPDSELTLYAYAPSQARDILENAGWIDRDADGYRENLAGNELAFTFKTPNRPFRVASSMIFVENMADIGIRITPEYYPLEAFLQSRDFDIAEFAWGGAVDDDPPLSAYVSSDTQNFSGYNNPAFDAAMANATAAPSNAEKLPYLIEAQKLLSEDLPILPLFTRYSVNPVSVPTGNDITVSLESYLTIHFDQVETTGQATVISTDSNTFSLPQNFQLLGEVYDIGTNAQFTNAQVCFTYDDTGLEPAQESAIRLFHLENNTWTDVTDSGYPDTVNNKVCGTVTSFSPFAIMYRLNQPPVAEAGSVQTVFFGNTVTLNASASSDPEAGVLTYAWDLDNDGQFDDATGVTTVTSFNQVGAHTIGLRVIDDGGLSDTDTTTVTILAWTLKGFYQPVDMNGVYNVVKGGSTVPLKFETLAGNTELTDVTNIKSLTYAQTSCDANAITDEIETTATGNTSLRYADGQFIYNWKTPNTAGKCYRVTMTTIDGSSLVAYFRLK